MTEPLMFGFGETKPENEDYPLEFTGHYLIGMNPETEEDGGYWDTPQEARLEFSLQFAELSGDAEGKFLFVRKAPMLEMHKSILDQANLISEHAKALEVQRLKLEALERKSIVCWAERHPKLSVFVISLVLVLGTIIDLRVVVAKLLGVDL